MNITTQITKRRTLVLVLVASLMVTGASLIVSNAVIGQVTPPIPPQQKDFPMGEVLLSPPIGPALPAISEQQALEAAVKRVIGEQAGTAFLATNPSYVAQLQDFSFNPAFLSIRRVNI